MSQINYMGQCEIEGSLSFFNHCSVSNFLNCVKSSCFTIQENQIPILHFMKDTLLQLKSEVDQCVNFVIGQELQLKANQCNQVQSFDETLKIEKKQNDDSIIVIHGLENSALLNEHESKLVVKNFFQNALDVNPGIKTVKSHLSKSNKLVAVVKLTSQKEKSKIFGNCHKLKNFASKISIVDSISQKKFKSKMRPRLENICSSDDLSEKFPEVLVNVQKASNQQQPIKKDDVCLNTSDCEVHKNAVIRFQAIQSLWKRISIPQ